LNQISHITALVKQAAAIAGFELAGIAPVSDFPDLNHFQDWIAAGHAGEMKYMESRDAAGHLKRASLKSTFPWARTVIVCAINYNTAQPYSTIPSEAGLPATRGARRITTTPLCSGFVPSKRN
jgi:epoxyqueuosine reductase